MRCRSTSVLLMLCVMTLLAGCRSGPRGSGIAASSPRTLEPFDRMLVSGEANVNVRLTGDPSRPPTAVITTDDNLLDAIQTTVRGRTLVLDTRGRFSRQVGARVDVEVPALVSLTHEGTGLVRLSDLVAERFNVIAAGEGDVELSGNVRTLSARLPAFGDVDASDVRLDSLIADILGPATLVAAPQQRALITISGPGVARLTTEPRELEQKVTGRGSITLPGQPATRETAGR